MPMELVEIKDEIKDIDIPFDWLDKEIHEYLLLKRNKNSSKQMVYNKYFYITGIIDTLRCTKHISQQMYTISLNVLNSV